MAKIGKQPKSLRAMRNKWDETRESNRRWEEMETRYKSSVDKVDDKKTQPYTTPKGVTMSPEYIDNLDINKSVMAGKGLKGQLCNRTACQAPGAYWFNHSTRAYYCKTCADLINSENRHDTYVKNLGHDLLTYEGT